MIRVACAVLTAFSMGSCVAGSLNTCDQASDLRRTKLEQSSEPKDKLTYAIVFGLGSLTEEQLLALSDQAATTEALSLLVTTASPERLKYLLSLGIDPDSRTTDGVPLIVAASACKRAASVNALIYSGADIYATDPQGVDAMTAALIEDAQTVVDSLTAAGYRIDAYSETGKVNLRLSRALHGGKYESHLRLLGEEGKSDSGWTPESLDE